MANITASMVKELREMTGAGMMECKKALAEAEAITYLRNEWNAVVDIFNYGDTYLDNICLTNEKQYYTENYPEIVVESGSLDQVILMLTGGEM